MSFLYDKPVDCLFARIVLVLPYYEDYLGCNHTTDSTAVSCDLQI